MTTFGSEISFSVITLLVVAWGYTQVRSLDQAVASQSDRYTVFTMKRRLAVKAAIAGMTLFSAVYIIRWLSINEVSLVGPVAEPVAFRTFSMNVIDMLICLQVVWDVRAAKKGAALKLDDAKYFTTQKRQTDPNPGSPLP